MEKPKRARRQKPDTAKVNLEPRFAFSGGQGVHREVEAEGHAEKYRAVIEGATPKLNWPAQGGTWSRALLIHPPHQGACGRHGTEEQCVTSGELAESLGGTGASAPISESEMASEAPSVVGLPQGI